MRLINRESKRFTIVFTYELDEYEWANSTPEQLAAICGFDDNCVAKKFKLSDTTPLALEITEF